MTMGQIEYSLGCNVGFRVASKHTGQVLNRLEKKMRRGLGTSKYLERRLPWASLRVLLLALLQSPTILVGRAKLIKAFPTIASPLPSP